MSKHVHILGACRVDRLFTAALLIGALLSRVQDSRAQAPPPPIYKMQPLGTLPGQPNSDRPFVTQVAQAAPAPPAPPADQVADGAAQPLNPPASASTPAVSQDSFAPNMIGDAFGPGFLINGMDIFASPGGSVGSSKIAENASPMPRDRVYLNYSYFDGVPLLAGGVNVNRLTPGIEKTFFNGMSSIEVRMPFASTLSNTLFIDGQNNPNDTRSTELGNLTLFLKQLLYTSDTLAVSGGLGLALPTASNVNVFFTQGQPVLHIENQSVHLLPFLGALYTPTDHLFVQQFLQFDFDTNGNAVSQFNGQVFLPAGRLNEMSFLYYSIGAGYWLYDDPNSDRLFTRIAPIVELHYNKSLTNTDALLPPNDLDLLNGVVGMTAMMGQNKSLTLAYTTPLSNFHDRQFNGELRVMFNWFFGGSTNRFSRVQF